MRMTDLEIKEMWAPTGQPFVRAKVVLQFESDAFEGGMPVQPAIAVRVFIPHDGTASLDTVERELLAETQRVLSLGLQQIAGKTPAAIREEAAASKPAEAWE